MFLVTRYGSDTVKEVEEPIATCGVETIHDFADPPDLFKAKCMTCHSREKNQTGPALKGIQNRQPYPNWFGDFVTNQDSLVNAGEPYTDLIMDYSPVEYNHNFKELNKEELNLLLDYFKK